MHISIISPMRLISKASGAIDKRFGLWRYHSPALYNQQTPCKWTIMHQPSYNHLGEEEVSECIEWIIFVLGPGSSICCLLWLMSGSRSNTIHHPKTMSDGKRKCAKAVWHIVCRQAFKVLGNPQPSALHTTGRFPSENHL